MMQRIRKDLEEHGAVDQEPKMEGRQLTMVLAPVKKSSKSSFPIRIRETSRIPGGKGLLLNINRMGPTK